MPCDADTEELMPAKRNTVHLLGANGVHIFAIYGTVLAHVLPFRHRLCTKSIEESDSLVFHSSHMQLNLAHKMIR